MILVKELIKELQKQDQDSYVAIGDGVLHSGLGSEYTSYILNGTVNNRGPVNKDDFLELNDMREDFKEKYDESKDWIELE